jgi:hypothetical protein
LENARAVIILDTEELHKFFVAAMGGETQLSVSNVGGSAMREGDFTRLEINLSGLKGGHSGAYLHESRAHAAFVGLEVLQSLTEMGEKIGLLKFEAGKVTRGTRAAASEQHIKHRTPTGIDLLRNSPFF